MSEHNKSFRAHCWRIRRVGCSGPTARLDGGAGITLRRKPRPLRKTYQPLAPYEVEREDQEDGDITFEVTDMRPDSYRRVCWTNDDSGQAGTPTQNTTRSKSPRW